jgi:glycosyltransferase involved in cell wall biosynthesis
MTNEPSAEPVSVVTPTYGRADLLPAAYRIFASQTWPDLEWVVIDDSPERCVFFNGLDDPRVKYIHLPERASTGNKRNIGVENARGSIIVNFDDDDYYHPSYVETMVGMMSGNNADFIKLSSIFIYHQKIGALGYWELGEKGLPHFIFGPNEQVSAGHRIREDEMENMHLAYGFCYVFRRHVWEKSPFPDSSNDEDTPFVKKAIENGFRVALVSDTSGLALHVIHDRNSSRSLPQFLLPHFMLGHFFPAIGDFLGPPG